jgi:hypothetical protein
MLDLPRILAGSAACVRGVTLGVPALLAVLWFRGRRRPRAACQPLALGPQAEWLAMIGLVAYVLVTRLAFVDAAAQPRWYFSQVGPLHMAEALRGEHVGQHWLGLLVNVQVLWEHQSPIMAPFAAAAQLALGPSLWLPTMLGAWWSLLAVLVAWRFGRSVESALFGVLFAGFVAVSPLQLTWARLGGIYIGAPVHVLVVLWCGWLVGLRRGMIAAFLLGVLAWTSVYQYFAARIGLGLAPIALWAGWWSSDRGAGRLAALTAAFVLGLATCVGLHHAANPTQSLWPSYPGYTGNRGESDSWQLLASAVTDLRSNTGTAVRAYFWRDRMGPLAASITGQVTPWTGTAFQADMTGGGLALLPVVLLGVLGLLQCLRHPRARALWLAFAAVSFLPIGLGVPSARRFLVFDAAWCAFAAFGLSTMLGSRVFAVIGARTRRRLAGGLIGAVGIWSAAAIALGAAALPPARSPIPFGESGFGDGLTCLACLRSGRSWQHEIEDGRMVILLDTDLDRENRTAPGGLWLYGKLAGLTAGSPDRFLDFYALVSNFDAEPPRIGYLGPHPPEDVPAALAGRIDASAPGAIVWWFSQPSAWERTLADALVAAGSSRSRPPLPPTGLSDRPSALGAHALRVETPWERRADALRALRGLVEPNPGRRCVRLELVAQRDYGQPPLAITPLGASDQPPEWGIASWQEVRAGTASLPIVEAIGFDSSPSPGGTPVVHLVDFWGARRTWTVGGAQRVEGHVDTRPLPLGRDCAVRQRGEWWVADPIAGTLAPVGRLVDVSLAGVMGVVPHGDDLLVATADQQLHVVNPQSGKVLRSFPATVVPTRRTHYGECAMLASGDGWIASLDQMRGQLYVYDDAGRPLGRVPLASTLGTSPMGLQAIRGSGGYLGVAHDLAVTTVRVVPDRACAAGAP